MAAPTFVAINQSGPVSGNGQGITQPSGTQTGDALYAFFGQNDTGEDSIPESIPSEDEEWTEVNNLVDDTENTTRLIVMRRIIEDGDPSTFQTSWTDIQSLHIFAAMAIRGADATTPEAATPTGTTGDSDSPDPPASGTVASGDYLAIAYMSMQGKRGPNSGPTNYTERLDFYTTGGGGPSSHLGMGISTRELTGITSENPGVFTASNGDTWTAGMILVQPPQDQTITVNEVAETEAAVAVAVGDTPISVAVGAAPEVEAAVAVAVIQPAAQSIVVAASAEVEQAVAIDALTTSGKPKLIGVF
jgi:hypothetical protein